MLAFERLPGIGPKTASRLAFYMLRAPADVSGDLSDALKDIKTSTTLCKICFNVTAAGRDRCEICASADRDNGLVCVVEEPMDVLALERTGGFAGRYHVLHGALSPSRVSAGRLAHCRTRGTRQGRQDQGDHRCTNPSMEGDATALYLRQRLEAYPVHLTRLARATGGRDLEYADQSTLLRALAGRQDYKYLREYL